MQGWLSSPAHRANIEQPGFASTGIAAAATANGVVFWAESFGTSAVAAAPPAAPPAAHAPAEARRAAGATALAVGRSLDRHALRGDRRFTLRFPVVQTGDR